MLAVSAAMRHKAAFLESALANYQIPTERLEIPAPYDLPALLDLFVGWLAQHEHEPVALNVTGGTKPMAIAAQEAFRMVGKAVFYVNVETDEVFWLEGGKPVLRLSKPIPLKTYLALHGYSMKATSAAIPQEWKALGGGMVENAVKWQKALSRLNMCAKQAEDHHTLEVPVVDVNGFERAWDELMEALYYNEIVQDRKKLRFASPAARTFANGGWIEHHVFEVVKGLEEVQSPAMNVVVNDADGNQNELDVAFLCRNRLFIVECKTKRFQRVADRLNDPAAETLYKLDSLRKTGGLRTRGILVSFMPVADLHKQRAEANTIMVIDQSCLPRLKECLVKALK